MMREPEANNEQNWGEQSPPPEKEPRAPTRIYVASLADYNEGRLHGEWIDADQTAVELEQAVKDMLSRSPLPGAEEWAIHDYEGFGPLRLSEYESLDYVASVAAGIAEHGPAFAGWADNVGSDRDALDAFEDVYYGAWDSIEQYAEDMLEDLGYADGIYRHIPEHMRPYVIIDVIGFARDLESGGDITVIDNPDGGIWIFDGR
jgi:antirestriction protein